MDFYIIYTVFGTALIIYLIAVFIYYGLGLGEDMGYKEEEKLELYKKAEEAGQKRMEEL